MFRYATTRPELFNPYQRDPYASFHGEMSDYGFVRVVQFEGRLCHLPSGEYLLDQLGLDADQVLEDLHRIAARFARHASISVMASTEMPRYLGLLPLSGLETALHKNPRPPSNPVFEAALATRVRDEARANEIRRWAKRANDNYGSALARALNTFRKEG